MGQENFFVAEGAYVFGDVIMNKGSSVWFGSVLRADHNPIVVGEYSNIQDGSIIHVSRQFPVQIGNYVSIGHRAVLHACRIDDLALIGIGAIVLDGAVVGEGSIIGAGAVVTPGTVIPARSLVLGVPGKVIRTVTEEEVQISRYLLHNVNGQSCKRKSPVLQQ
jgi:carbonic anhydrase/acetyltransferase-like protein (isoleucine patch superfamily)